jgi:hypothetical protein
MDMQRKWQLPSPIGIPGFANRHICNLPYLQYIEVVCNGENYRVLMIDDVAQSQRKNRWK